MSKVIPDLKILLILLFLSLTIFILDKINLLNLPKQLAFYITNPISFGIYNTNRNIGKQFYFLFLARKAGQENKALKEQVGQLLSENANLRKNIAEITAQLSQEKYLDPGTYNLLPARLIGLSRYLKIDKGSSSGVKVGQPVVFEDSFIGKIVLVSPSASNVELLTDPDSKVAAFSQNKDGQAKGVLVGQFGTAILMDKILHEEKIAQGNLVYSEGLEGFLPRGLILGKVTEVLERENEVFKQAKVSPIFDIRDLELVFVIQE
ncbi:MAG: rod shape-determining protein MreC [Candidatus Daviesbacteria bacterium]|nr:rod shape-determining protein MreC [Candidatus Daviesbacteria bacterium]